MMYQKVHNFRVDLFVEQLRDGMQYGCHIMGGSGSVLGFRWISLVKFVL